MIRKNFAKKKNFLKICFAKIDFCHKSLLTKMNFSRKEILHKFLPKKDFTENKIVGKDLPKKFILKEFIAKKNSPKTNFAKKIMPKKISQKNFCFKNSFFAERVILG